MNKLSYFILIIIFIIILISPKDITYMEIPKEDLIAKQKYVDGEIKRAGDNESYTISNPKIINNPYYISPLTSLIIFSSPECINLEVYINDQLYKEIKEERKFIIPIIGLKEDFNNKISITSENEKYDYYIKTEDVSNVSISCNNPSNLKYLISSPNLKHSIIDSEGNIIWYLDLDSQGLIEPIDNDTFLIGVEESEMFKNTQAFSGIYEINYLGKIIKRFDTPYKYHHEIKYLGNYRALILGSGDNPMGIVYEMDLQTGEITNIIDLYDVLGKTENIKQYLKNLEYGLGTNSVDYLNGKLLLSLRNINTIISLDYQTREIEYILSSDEMIKDNLKEYIINIDENLLGMHNAKYIDANTISLYNNGYDYTQTHKNQQASGLIINISENKAKAIQKYTLENKYSYAYGSFDYNQSNVLINYSYMYKEKTDDMFSTPENFYTNLVLYKKNREFTKININDVIYKAKTFDVKVNSSYQIKEYAYYNESLKEGEFKIKRYQDFPYEVNVNKNSLELMMDTTDLNIELIFQGKKTYTLKYLNTKTFYKIPSGNYKLFIKINEEYYKYKNILQF